MKPALLLPLLFLLGLNSAFATFESYCERPDIRKIDAKSSHPSFSENEQWGSHSDVLIENLKLGSLEAIAEILGMYPDYQIYVMGRDAEFLYDTALAIIPEAAGAARFHLILTSSSILKDPHLKNYLEQEGITEEALEKKQKFLFVDTGYTGGASNKLIALYPKQFASQFRTHLLCSNNPKIPSTRVFLSTFDPAFENINPSNLKWKLVGKLENFPMYYSSGDHFEKDPSGRWNPMCPEKSASLLGGAMNKELAFARIQEVKVFMSDPAHIKRFEEKATLWKTLETLWKNQKQDDLQQELKKILAQYKTLGRSIVRDFIETVSLNLAADDPALARLTQFKEDQNLAYKRPRLKGPKAKPWKSGIEVKPSPSSETSPKK